MPVKSTILFLLCISLAPSIAAQSKFSITITTGQKTDGLYFTLDLVQQNRLIKGKKEGSKIRFSDTLKYEAEYAVIHVYCGKLKTTIPVFLAPRDMQMIPAGKSIKDCNNIAEQFNFIHFPYQKDLNDYFASIKPELRQFESLRNALYKKMNLTDAATQNSYMDTVAKLKRPLLKRKIRYFTENNSQYVALYFFYTDIIQRYDTDTDSMKTLFEGFSPAMKQTLLGQEIAHLLSRKSAVNIGSDAPLFEAPDSSSVQHSLQSFAGRFVLLQFWASWCIPCKRHLPILTALQKKYDPAKFVIIGISVQDKINPWKNSLIRYQPQWLNLSDANNTVGRLYDIRPVPQYFLVDEKGKIVYHNITSNDDDDLRTLIHLLHTRLGY
jgi:thiol-disulfide isomerase/thioredoxin